MSVAGILGSSLFANAASQVAQKLVPSAKLNADAQSVFGDLQKGLINSGATSSTGATSLTGQLSQIGQDLTSGNLPAAQADFSAFKLTLAQDATQLLNRSASKQSSNAGNISSTGASGNSSLFGAGSNPAAAAMLAYSSLQQSAMNGALNASVLPLSITA
jgi:hypothetical protein